MSRYKFFFYNEGQAIHVEYVNEIPNHEKRVRIAAKACIQHYDRFVARSTSTGIEVLDSDYIPDMIIVGGQEIFTAAPKDTVEDPPKYVVKYDANLLDAFTCKDHPDKLIVAHLAAGTKILLFDCDPDATNSNLVGVKTANYKHVGYIDKTLIEKDPEA